MLWLGFTLMNVSSCGCLLIVPIISAQNSKLGMTCQQQPLPHKTCYRSCRGVDTADVLEQGLSCRAIALGNLKGLIGTKDTRESFYTSSAPYDEGKSLRLVGIGIAEVSISKRLNSPAWLSTWLFLVLNRHRVIPLYTRVDTWWPTESRPAHNRVRLGDFLYMPFFTNLSLHITVYSIRP